MPCSFCAELGHNITTCPRRVHKLYVAEVKTDGELDMARRTLMLATAESERLAEYAASLVEKERRLDEEKERIRSRENESFLALCDMFTAEIKFLQSMYSQAVLIGKQLESLQDDTARSALSVERAKLIDEGIWYSSVFEERTGGKLALVPDATGECLEVVPTAK